MKNYSFYLETERLQLREMREEDAQSFYELNADKDVLRYTGDKEFSSIEESQEFLKNYPSISYNKDGYGRWTCIDKTSNETLGWCGLRMQSNGEVDLGYRFHKRFWGLGYATESSLACLEYGFLNLHLDCIIARAAKENIASWKVMEKIGMQFRNEEFLHQQAGYIYQITKTQWMSRQSF